MTSHLLHEIADQLSAAAHLACEILTEMYQNRSDITVVDAVRCRQLWHIIESIGSINLDLYNADATTIATTGDEPITGTWQGNRPGAETAQRSWSEMLTDQPGIRLSREVIHWVIDLMTTNDGSATSGGVSPIIRVAGDRMKPVYVALKKNVGSIL